MAVIRPIEQQMDQASLLAQIAELTAANAALKAGMRGPITLKVTPEGLISAYGNGKFPVTQTREQWLNYLDARPVFEACFQANKPAIDAGRAKWEAMSTDERATYREAKKTKREEYMAKLSR